MISLRNVRGDALAEFSSLSELPSQATLLELWSQGAAQFCVASSVGRKATFWQRALVARLMRDAVMFPFRWILKTERGETLCEFTDLIDQLFPREDFGNRFQVSPQFHWRRGPGFIHVEDERSAVRSIFLLEEEEIRLFERLAVPQLLSAFSPVEDELIGSFSDAGLVCGDTDWVLALPFRKQFWRAGEAHF
jgi:hypothetical protein